MKQPPVRRVSLESLLPWILLAWIAVLLVLLWRISSSRAGLPADSIADSGLAEGRGDLEVHPAAVAKFGAFVVEGGSGQVARDRDAIADGIEWLAETLMDITAHGPTHDFRMQQRIDELGTMAAMLRGEQLRRVQARVARHAFVAAAEVMMILQTRRYPHLERATADAREAALSVRTDRSLVAQGDEVQQFFERADDVVRAMTW